MRLHIAFLLLVLFSSFSSALGQLKNEKIVVTGLVVTGEDQYGVPGVHVYIPKAGKGVITNQLGYFYISSIPGDSLVISAIGYGKQHYIVPEDFDQRENISLIINLQEDTAILPVVTIYPWPTEALFKEAFLALELPETEHENMRKNMEENLIRYLAFNAGPDASLNHKYFMDQQWQQWRNENSLPVIQLLNPFAWAQFIKSVKNGDLKKKEWMDYEGEGLSD